MTPGERLLSPSSSSVALCFYAMAMASGSVIHKVLKSIDALNLLSSLVSMASTDGLLPESSNITTQSPLHFPSYTSYPNQRDTLVNPDLHEGDRTKKYIRALPRELVSYFLDTLVCKYCKKGFSADNMPQTLYCGHYVHSICLEDKHINAECPCLQFPKGNVEERKEKRPDRVLGEIFTALEEDGYRCNDCKDLHPQFNCVYWVGYDGAANSSPYYCVWCAANDEKHIKKEFRIIEQSDVKSEKMPETERLRSLDCTQMKLLNSWVQCCHCLDVLIDTDKRGVDPKCVYLNCGHICHKEHLGKGTIFCNFESCATTYPVSPIKDRGCLIEEYLGVYEKTTRFSIYGKMFRRDCAICAQSHARGNFTENSDMLLLCRIECVWCTVMANDRTRRMAAVKKSRLCSLQ